jgi:hypothetical protein
MTGGGNRACDRRRVGDSEALWDTILDVGAQTRRSVVADAVHIEIAVRSGRSAIRIVEESHRDGVCPDPPVAHEGEALAAARRVRHRCGERARQLYAIDCDGELCVAQIGVL